MEFCNGNSGLCFPVDLFNATPTSDLYEQDSRWPHFRLDPVRDLDVLKRKMDRGPHPDNAVCANCQHMTTGSTCDHCKIGFFGGAANGQDFCQPCDCNGHGDLCDEVRKET